MSTQEKKKVKDKKETSSQKSNSQWSVYPTNDKQTLKEKCKLKYQGGITEHKPDLQNC